MKTAKHIIRLLLAIVFFLLSLAVAAIAVQVCIHADSAQPVIDDPGPGSPTETLERFFTGLQAGDFDSAYSYLSNYSTLGLETRPDDPISALFWDRQRASWEYSVAEGYDMEGTVLIKRVTVESLDLSPVAPLIHAQVQASLEQAVEDARLKSDVYNDDGSYKEEVVLAALGKAAQDALTDVSPYRVSKELTVKLSYLDGKWLIAADQELVSALTGGAVH